MLWGGLRPIPSRLVIDSLTLVGVTYAALTSPWKARSSLLLVIACVIILATSGLTNRWTLTLPLAPFLMLQALRRISTFENSQWVSRTITALSMLLIFSGASLSILFPAVELPPFEGPYNVGIANFHLDVEFSTGSGETCSAHTQLPVRLLYPTLEKPEAVPLLNVDTAIDFCRESMAFGAPPPLRPYGWILHTWRLTSVRAKLNADLLPGSERLPLIIFSHGLGGSAEVYSYQAMSLAAQGNVVLQLNHQDGSAPIVQLSNGTTITYDRDIITLRLDEKNLEYVTERRSRTELRVQELIAATEALHKLDQYDIPGLRGLSLRGRLAKNETYFMGHSFGGATALTAAMRRPDLAKSVIAHDPAVDWMPDDARRSLFPEDRLMDLEHSFTGGTGGFGEEKNSGAIANRSLHDLDMLVLFSYEWSEKNWAGSDALLGMYANNRFGPAGGVSAVGIVELAHHTEFSDTSMLTPLWLARAVGLTGIRNPLETAKEIHERTKAFIDAVRRRSVKRD
jgi:pimeloyl-ACP methyl ester carboxylesterase